ncbi:MAG: SDR family oxidoreductase [Pseudomonadales bacterium]
MGKLEGRVALITGAARGQGEAEARLFAAEGATIVMTDVLDAQASEVVRSIGPAASYHRLDVTEEAGWKHIADDIRSRHGKLDVLVNNAGVLRLGPLEHTTLEDYLAVIRVNQVGVFLGMRAAIPLMKAAGGGSIINVSSIDGLVGMTYGTGYVASKFAVRGMTKVAALELGRERIRVNSIHPGGVDTAMVRGDGSRETSGQPFSNVPLGRIGVPEDIARMALFLASDDSAYCTGAEFIADGGLTAGFDVSDFLGR